MNIRQVTGDTAKTAQRVPLLSRQCVANQEHQREQPRGTVIIDRTTSVRMHNGTMEETITSLLWMPICTSGRLLPVYTTSTRA